LLENLCAKIVVFVFRQNSVFTLIWYKYFLKANI